MPYLRQQDRDELDTGMPPILAGDLNYLITKAVDRYLVEMGVNYGSLNAAVGALECAKLEMYRRLVALYEDTKKDVNGDVYCATVLRGAANVGPSREASRSVVEDKSRGNCGSCGGGTND